MNGPKNILDETPSFLREKSRQMSYGHPIQMELKIENIPYPSSRQLHGS